VDVIYRQQAKHKSLSMKGVNNADLTTSSQKHKCCVKIALLTEQLSVECALMYHYMVRAKNLFLWRQKMTEALQNQLKFLGIADGMKQVFRQTTLIDGTRYENAAEHSWHFALMAMTLLEHCVLDGVNIDRVIKMAIVHDLVEVFAGDTPANDIAANVDKDEREREAADKLFALLPDKQANEYRSLWEEFDAMKTPDSIYASAVDRFQSFYLIHKSGTGSAWVKFNATAERTRTRVLPVKSAIPSLWQWIEDAIDENIAKGLLVN